ncbi:MAG: DbpA RNA binding domain-containing protein, partial [Gemmatimonadales bacterium]
MTPPLAEALDMLGWNPEDALVRDTIPTAARGHNLVVAAPPSACYDVPAIAGLLSAAPSGGSRSLLLCPGLSLPEWTAAAVPLTRAAGLSFHAAAGLARAGRRLQTTAIDLLIASPEAALDLHRRSALRIEQIGRVILAWPEALEDEEALALVLQDLPKDAQRLVFTGQPDRVASLVERYARRAPITGPLAGTQPATTGPVGPVRTMLTPWRDRAVALGWLIELLDPTSLTLWVASAGGAAELAGWLLENDTAARIVVGGDAPPAELIVAWDLPTPERLGQLKGAGEVVLLVPPYTDSYVERTASHRRPVRRPGWVEAAAGEAAARRGTIAGLLEAGRPEAALLALAPLFEQYEPAAVAAALYRLWAERATPPAVAPAAAPEVPGTAKLWVGIGKKDGVTANDLVGCLTREVRLDKTRIGRIEIRELFSLVEVPGPDAERVATAMSGLSIRRRRITVRVDRGARRPSGGR